MSPSARSPQRHKLVVLTAGSKDNQDALNLSDFFGNDKKWKEFESQSRSSGVESKKRCC